MKTKRRFLFRHACFLAVPAVMFSSCDKARKLASDQGFHTPARPAVAYEGAWVRELDADTYPTFMDQPGRVVLVDFHADWCGPCRNLAPILERIAQENQGLVLVGKVNVDSHKGLAAKEGVRGIPDVRVYRDGKRIDQFVGTPGEAKLREQIKRYTKGLQPVPEPSTKSEPGQSGATIAPMPKDWLPPGMNRR